MSTGALLGNARVAKMNIRQGRMENKRLVHCPEVLASRTDTNLPSQTGYQEMPCSTMDVEGEMESDFICLLLPSSTGQCLPVESSSLHLIGQTVGRSLEQQLELSKGPTAPGTK